MNVKSRNNHDGTLRRSDKTNSDPGNKYKKEFLYLVLWSWNVGGLIKKIQWDVFKQCVMESRPDVVNVQETWSIKHGNIPGYKTHQAPA